MKRIHLNKILHEFSILILLLGSIYVSSKTEIKDVKALAATSNLTPPSRPTLPTNPMVSASDPKSFGYQNSIASTLTTTQKTQIVLFSSTSATGSLKVEYSGAVSSANLSTATAKIVSNNNNQLDYVLYIGGNVTAPAFWNSQWSNGSNNFEAMNKKAKSVTLINNPDDPLTSSNAQAPNSKYTLTFPKGTNVDTNAEPEVYFGCNTVFRNLTFQSQTPTAPGTAFNTAGAGKVSIYAQGNKFAMAGGAWCLSTLNLVGGSKNSDVNWTSTDGNVNHGAGQAGSNLWVASTGAAGTQVLAGMDSTNNTLNGDAHATVVGIGSGGINYYEGTNAGTINGNIYNDIRVTAGSFFISNIWGGGNSAVINGNVTTSVNNTATVALNTFYGGFNSSGTNRITGTIYNTIAGNGTWNGNFGYFVGGTRFGNVGTSGTTSNSISNSFDTSNFSSGDALFVGGNDRAYSASNQGTGLSTGVLYGNVTNYIKAGFTTGRIIGVTGVFGMHFNALNGTSSGISTNSSYTYTPTQSEVNNFVNTANASLVDTNVAASPDGKSGALYGNAYTYIQSGIASVPSIGSTLEDSTAAYTRGGGFLGYIKGNTTVELGTSNGTTVGGVGVVSAAGWTGNALSSTTSYNASPNTSLSSIAGYQVFGGGGTSSRAPLGYFQTGQSSVIQNNVIAHDIYGGNYSGILNGNSINVVNAGLSDTSSGAGYQDAAQLGNSELDVYHGQIDSLAIAAGKATMGMKGNAQAILNADSYINGSVYGYVGSVSGILKGNTTVNVIDSNLNGAPAIGTKIISGGAYQGSVLGNTDLEFSIGSSSATTALPANTVLSGSGSPGAPGGVGSGSTNSTVLNVSTTKNNLLNNSVMLYGDASTGVNTSLGKNTITVNAANNAMLGKILSTAYTMSNLTTPAGQKGLSQNTLININSLSSVASVSAGGDNDNYTDSMPLNGNTATINIGDNVNPITIATNKITSFTNFNLNNSAALTFNGVGLVNGGTTATAVNHATSYSKFGDAVFNSGSSLTFSKATTIASLSKLTVNGKATYNAPYSGVGQFNLSSYSASAGSSLNWLPTTSLPVLDAPTSALQNIPGQNNVYTGNYNGTQQGYVVFTFTGGTPATGSAGIIEPNVTSAYTVNPGVNTNFYSTNTSVGPMYGDFDKTTFISSGFSATGNQPTALGIMSPVGNQSYEIPTSFDFGQYNVMDNVQTTSKYIGDLTSTDTRFSKWASTTPWKIQVSETKPITSTDGRNQVLQGYTLNYASGDSNQVISNSTAVAATQSTWGYDNVSENQNWATANGTPTHPSTASGNIVVQGNGVTLTVPAGAANGIASNTKFEGELTWSINNVPSP